MSLLYPLSVLPQRPGQTDASSSTGSEFSYEDVCKPGSTLLWDLVQEDKVVSRIFYLGVGVGEISQASTESGKMFISRGQQIFSHHV